MSTYKIDPRYASLASPGFLEKTSLYQLVFEAPPDMQNGFGFIPNQETGVMTFGPTHATHLENMNYLGDHLGALVKVAGRVPEVVVDIGASVGVVSGVLKQLGSKIIWAYEPNPVLYSFLVRNVFQADPSRRERFAFIPMQLAVWNKSGLLISLRQRGSLEQSGLVYCDDASHLTFVVTVSLTDVLQLTKSSVNLLKIDVEGAEHVFLP